MKVGWKRCSVSTTGLNFVGKLSKCLWYIDPHHSKFASRGMAIPSRFEMFQGYNDYKKNKKKEPRLSATELNVHIHTLSESLMQPWFSISRYKELREDVEKLVDALKKYSDYLATQARKVTEHQQELLPVVPQEENAAITTINSISGCISSVYSHFEEKLRNTPVYDPIFVNELAPLDRYQRRKWMASIQLSFPIMLYKYVYGNHLGTLVYAWRIPEDQPVDITITSRIFMQLCNKQLHFSTRAMRQEFLNRYGRITKASPMILRNIYRTLLHDSTSPEQPEVDERVAKAIIELDDPEVILDLRKSNGNPKSSLFDPFWDELQAYLDEITPAVDKRRHGEVLHMPYAVSLRHLREIIAERLQQKFPDTTPTIPSSEWLRLQFWPTNQYTNRAIHYTGRFKVKFGVQVRQLRKEHPDSHYVSALLQYVRHFSVAYQHVVTLVSVDDKAIIPVGEPHCPVSTGVRGHNRSLVPLNGPQVQALDHDFHVNGIVPSVAFFVDVPDNGSDTFFRGIPFITNKDKVTQPSSALRHATEMSNLIKMHEMMASKHILVIVSDGGPDHRVTFGSVQVSSLTLFRALDLDMLICVRTCPYQSWTNIAERIMSTLNLALQNVSLARKSMGDHAESLVKNKNTLGELREALKGNSELGSAFKDSMSVPLLTVGKRFQAMKVKDNQVQLGVPATEAELIEQFKHALFFDPSLSENDLSAKTLSEATQLQSFMKAHCHASAYAFQVKKCMSEECFYCQEHPIRLPIEEFQKLNFLPLPLLDLTKEHYRPFQELYGTSPSDKDQPSKVVGPSEDQKQRDKARKSLLTSAKVRSTISCGECGKARCVYAHSKLTPDQASELERLKELNLYTCGSCLSPNDECFIVVREGLVCSSPIEAQYYGAALVSFPPICYHCGLGEESLVNNDYIQDLKKQYAVVSPICFLCYSEGKKPSCRLPSNVKKPRLS